mgnify:CR=1 FL=1
MEENIEPQKQAKSIINDIKSFFKDLLNIERDTDKSGTVEEIKSNISMQGHNAWILIFSIVIASIGLNVSSTAVVIGAMLISPLMGPILGVGLSIATNDIDTLRKSLVNLGFMVLLSLLTSTLFFSISLFNEATPEILARTAPDVRDVLIAFAGGLALIIAISRPSPQTNTVAGVAIATALMPPLCTAGFGLGTGNFDYFFGAMFLFTINTIFIALSTFLVVKYLKFPIVKYLDSKRKKAISRIAMIVATVILGFSIYSFYTLFQENTYNKEARAFIQELRDEGVSIIGDDDSRNINYKEDYITFYILGNAIPNNQIAAWEKDLKKYSKLQNTKLNVKQEDDTKIQEQVKNLTDLYAQNQKIISSRDESIEAKNARINELEKQIQKYVLDQIPFAQICEEVKINYSGVEKISFAQQLNSDFNKIDTLKVFNVKWFDSIPNKTISTEEIKLEKWLKSRLILDTLVLKKY